MQTKTKTYATTATTGNSPVYDLLLTDSLCNENSRLTDEEKELYQALCNVSAKTLWGNGINHCMQRVKATGNADLFRELVKSLGCQLEDCPQIMKSIIGAECLCALRKVSSRRLVI
jgi:hypothetical protein